MKRRNTPEDYKLPVPKDSRTPSGRNSQKTMASYRLDQEAPLSFRCDRILIYTACYNVIDGVSLTIRKLEQEILASGGQVTVLTTRSGCHANTHLDGTHPSRQVIFLDNSVPIPFLHDPNNPENTYELGFSLSDSVKSQIDDFNPSIVHITVPDCAALCLMQYARDLEIPIMGTHHSNIPEYMAHYPGMRWLGHILAQYFRHYYNFLQTLYVTTPYMHRYLVETYKLDQITEIGIWGRGIDLDRFSPQHRSDEFRKNLGIDSDEVVICFVGRLVPEKRPDIFANVIKRLHERNIPFHALIIGSGPLEDEMKMLPRTTCMGWMSGDDLAVAYASSDIFLFPSAVETFGNVTLEAAASGLPVVVEAGCSGHLVQEGINGYGCEADDFESFYQATLDLLTDAEKRKDFSLHSRKISAQLEKRKVARQMLVNYSRVSNDFYCKYGGHHKNRDRAYQNKDSFLAGMHPRPTSLVLIEILFVYLFKVVWFLLSMYQWFENIILKPGYQWFQNNISLKRYSHYEPAESFANKVILLESQRDSTDVSLIEGDEISLPSTTDPFPDAAPIIVESEDDASAASVSYTSASESRKVRSRVSVGDGKLAQSASVLFVKMVTFVWRLESLARSTIENHVSLFRDKPGAFHSWEYPSKSVSSQSNTRPVD